MCIIVFCGASLEKKEIEEILGNDVYVVPPIKRGDLKKYKDGNIIAIIDGIFGGMLAISPQEIRESLELGNVILGSSSMGALRAAELEKDGMIGIGKIFQAYKSGNVDSDAEVAMIFSAKDYMPLSEPLIHIRFFVQDMIQKQVLSNGEGSTILEVSKNIYFPSLSFSKVFDKIQCCINNEKIEYMKNYYNSHKEEYNIKKKDAKELLNYIAKNKNIIIEDGGIKMG